MCLNVFCNGENDLYNKLNYSAQKLGSAFQKINFLRDIKEDMNDLGRSYFPELSNNMFNQETKQFIEESIQKDFDEAWQGVKQLPGRSKLAVALAFYYYKSLLSKIKRVSYDQVLKKRIRIPILQKYLIILQVIFLYKTKRI